MHNSQLSNCYTNLVVIRMLLTSLTKVAGVLCSLFACDSVLKPLFLVWGCMGVGKENEEKHLYKTLHKVSPNFVSTIIQRERIRIPLLLHD